jgi:hypothetical protein
MRRFLLLTVATVAAVALVATTSASAGGPVFVPLPSGSFTDSTCGFTVTAQFSAGETLKQFSNGTVIVTGPLTGVWSANGKSVTVNVPGPFIAISGHTAYGNGVGAGDVLLPDGEVTIAYSAGMTDLSGPVGVLVHGTVLLDICAALAP